MSLKLLVAFSCILPLLGQAPQAAAPPAVPKSDEKPATVSGKTVSAAGQALKKATLTLRWSGPLTSGQAMPNPYTTTSDAEGKFTFEAVEPGKYMLSADRPGYQRMNYGSKRGLFGGTVLTLKSSQSTTARTCVRATGSPSLSSWLMTVGIGQTDNSDKDKHFSIKQVSPGKYRVYAWDDLEQGSQFDPEVMKTYETKSSKLDLAESAAPQVTLTVIKQ